MRKRDVAMAMLLALGIAAVSACGTAYKVAVDKRNLGTQAKDEQITMNIRSKLGEDETLKSLSFSTYCYEGQVYLVGEYDNPKQRTQAVKLAKEVEGVKSVKDHFLAKKKGDTCGTSDNLKLVAKISTELIKDKEISSTAIEVKAVQCNIVLLGLVGSKTEIDKAIAHAKGVEGVRSVTSYLKVAK
jgi:hyperosmotically inducible protein